MEDIEVRRLEIKTALITFSIFFTSVTLYYFCLSKTSVSSTIILGNTSSVFVFIFSLFILKEKFNAIKMVAMLFCAGGVVLIAFSDDNSSDGSNQMLGDFLGLVAAMLLGLYSTILAKMIPVTLEDRFSFFNVLGFLGTFCLFTFWPLLLIFHFAGWEKFELPSGLVWAYLSINIVFGTLLFDYCWGRATILLGPLLSNTSVIFVVPISMVVDSFFESNNFGWMYYLGTAGILVGFLIIALINYKQAQQPELSGEVNEDDGSKFLAMNES